MQDVPRLTGVVAVATTLALSLLPVTGVARAQTSGGAGGHVPSAGSQAETAAENVAETPAKDRILVHPLWDRADAAGRVPGIDVHDDPRGGRYLIEDGLDVDDHGRPTWTRGLGTARRHVPDAAERAALQRAKGEAGSVERPVDEPEPVIGPALEDALARAADTEPLRVVVRLRRVHRETLTTALQRRIGRGEVGTTDELRAARAELLETRRQAVAAAQARVVQATESAGGRVLSRGGVLPRLVLEADAARIRQLAADPDVVRIDLDREVHDAATPVSGHHVVIGTQIKQFVDAGMDGEWGSDITVAVVDSGFHDAHPAFRDYENGPWRIRGRYLCDVGGCGARSQFASDHPSHGTAVAGLAIGDLLDGQDPGEVWSSSRWNRSGYAGEARAYLYEIDGTAGLSNAFDHLITRWITPHAVNVSQGVVGGDPYCRGTSSLSRDVNDLFENGMLPVFSAGNEGHGSSSNCNLREPAAAIGAFTVGGHGTDDSVVLPELDIRLGPIYTLSSRGGVSWSEGRGRSIVDITAPAYRRYMLDPSDGYSLADHGTSFAAPTVTAAAADFVDFYKRTYSDLIDDPGILAANLLLMGDRQTEGGTRASHGFDGLWGAGRLKARKFDSEGMDGAWGYRTGKVCVGDGEIVTLHIRGGRRLLSTSDDFKAVIWWYDRRHESGQTVDDLDLWVENGSGVVLESSIDSYDNKERVYLDAAGGEILRLKIHGYDVTSDETECGTNAMSVYYAYFYEDDARDDGDGPNASIDRE